MMWPSSWATLLAQVAEVTGHAVKFIKRKMPLAQAYQYQQIFFANNRHWALKPREEIDMDSSARSALGLED